MKYFKYVFLIIIFLFASGFFAYKNIMINRVFESSQEIQYVIDNDFLKVKKVLMRTNVLEEIVSKEHGKIIDKSWNDFIVSSKRLFVDGVDIDGSGNFIVEKNDLHDGFVQLKFEQKIHASKDSIVSNVTLAEPCGHFKNIKTELTIVPLGNKKTLATNKIYLKYERLVPKNMVANIENILKKSVADSLQNNKDVILDLIKKHVDKQFIIPLK